MLEAFGQSWWTAGALALTGFSAPIPSTGEPATADPNLSCVDYRAEARHSGIGYDHLVHVSNQCDKAVKCDVSTNVNPDKVQIVVASKATETVLTWRGSPAREFTAAVSCRLSE